MTQNQFYSTQQNFSKPSNPDEFKSVITAKTYDKGIGMTEKQWNDIVLKNAQKERDEEAKKKDLLVKQRLDMKQ